MRTQWDAIIIGGGAAGLWAAGTAAQRLKHVLVLEKNNKAGVKILMSGGTRCNITHHCDSRKIADAFGKKGRVLLSVLSRLSPQDVVREFESEGVATKVEDTGKVFPVSDHAIDVRDAVVRRLARHGAELITGCAVESVTPSSTGIGFDVTAHTQTDRLCLLSKTVLITTGGLSYSGCGTTGDGYAWAKAMGHTIEPLRPALTPLVSNEAWVHELSGLTLDDIAVTAHASAPNGTSEKLERAVSRGGFLWTHTGCSGPTAMNVSRCFSDRNEESRMSIGLDLLPDQNAQSCEAWLLEEGTKSNRAISTVLSQRIPKRLALAILDRLGAVHDPHMAELPKKLRGQIIDSLKQCSIPIHGTKGYPKAEVTAGGVALGEVNFQDMQSRKQPGLFFAGEILDLDGPIGGYNFQAAWSTGHTAGLHLGGE
ncbi:MAG: aminoacetone oxidase family FAD-binding enzyme [Planctomycetota bacterium]